MAVITPVFQNRGRGDSLEWRYRLISWNNIRKGDTCEVAEIPPSNGRYTVQVLGNFSGMKVSIEGSLDGENFALVHSSQGKDLRFTKPDILATETKAMFYRVTITGGRTASDVSVILALMNG